jgi:hypothetical protein
MRKTYRAVAVSDSLGTWWEREAWLALTRLSLDGTFHQRIAEEYFKVNKVDHASFIVGLGVTPLARLTMHSREKNLSTGKDGTGTRSYDGVGGSWTLGIAALRQLSPGNGMEVGVVYQGHWMGYFRHDGHRLKRARLDRGDAEPGTPLSFMAHRFKLYFRVLIGRGEKAGDSTADDG